MALKESQCGRNRKDYMKLNFETNEETLFVSIEGRLDTTTSPLLEESLQKEWKTKNIQFDFKQLDYISSAGLRVLLATLKQAKRQDGTIKLLHLNNTVMEVFEITGFKKLFQL